MYTVEQVREFGTFLSEGAWREAYFMPASNKVYKIDKSPGYHFGTNACEWETYQFIKANESILPEGVKIPNMEYINGMIVSDYIVSAPYGLSSKNYDKLIQIPLHDMVPGNVLQDDEGTLWVVDLGNGSSDADTYPSASSFF